MPTRIKHTQRFSSSLTSRISPSQLSLPPFLSCTCLSSSSSYAPSSSNPSRSFSSTPTRNATKLREAMFDWLNGPGSAFKHPLPGSTNYLSAYDRQGKLLRVEEEAGSKDGQEGKKDGKRALPREQKQDRKPFPMNPFFVSESVLSEELRNEIHNQVVVQGQSLRTVSVQYGVDLRRVGAVVRLVELEKRMVEQKKPLARPYQHAVHQMVPTTPLVKNGVQRPHESINDLPVHTLTQPQIFYPVSESRQFNRVDAGRVFSAAPALRVRDRYNPPNSPGAISRITREPSSIERIGKRDAEEQVLQPADIRIPHPHLVASEYEKTHKYKDQEEAEQNKAFVERIAKEDAAQVRRRERKKLREEQSTTRVEPKGSRFEFRFRDAVVSRQTTGSTGRGTKAPGRRYGVPSSDRKRAQVKIPTKVVV